MAGSARRIVVEFIGEDRGLSSTAKRVEGTTGRLGGRLAKVGVIAGGLLVAGLGAAAVAAVKVTKAAAEDEAGQKRLATALKNTAGANKAQVAGVEKWISAQGVALGVTDDELRPALGRLVAATHDVGKAQKLASLAMDVSAGSGKSLDAVSTALAKAQNGNVGALGRLGVATKDAAGHTLSFDQIQKNLAKTFGGQAATKANTFQGKMDRLKLVFRETEEAIGSKLLPVVTKLASWFLDKGLPAITKFGKYLSAKLGPVFKAVGALMAKFSKDGAGSSGKFGQAIAKLKPIFNSVVSIVKSVVSIVTSLWKRFGGTITKYAESSFKNIVNIISGAFKVIAGIFKVVASLLKGDWKGVWEGIKQIVSGAWQAINGIVSQGWNVIKTLFSVAGSAIKGIFTGLWNALKAIVSSAWNGIKGLVTSGWNAIKSAFSSGASAVRGVFTGLWSGIKSIVTSGVTWLVNTIKSIPGKITALGGAMANAGKALMQSLLNGISRASGFVTNFASGLWNAVKKAIDSAIDKANATIHGVSINIPFYGKFKPFSGVSIPRLYTGGIVKGSRAGTLAVVGDRGRDEAVIPLSGPHAPNLGGGVTVVINGALDPVAVGRQVEQILVKYKRTTGRDLAFA